MEKKIEVQNGIIKELKRKLDEVEEVNKCKEIDEEKDAFNSEVVRLASEVEELQIDIMEKINLLDYLQKENHELKESFIMEIENSHREQTCDEGSTLRDELRFVENTGNKFHCELCSENVDNRRDLKKHKREKHKEESNQNNLTRQIDMLETKLLSQKSKLFSELLNLKEKEEKPICNCKSFCIIQHKIYNWNKPISSEILKKSRNILVEKI